VVAIVAGIHLAATLGLSATLNVWLDETYTLASTSNGPVEAAGKALRFEMQAPLYFVGLGAWRLLADGLFWARVPSAVCSTGAVVALALAFARYWPDRNPAWAALLASAHPLVVWAGTEARCYALLLFLTGLLAWLFHLGFADDRRRPLARWLYAVAALLAVYTQYYAVFVLLGQMAEIVVRKRWASLVPHAAVLGVVALAMTPLVWVIGSQAAGHTSTDSAAHTIETALRTAAWRLQDQLLPPAMSAGMPPVIESAREWAARLILAAAACLALSRREAGLLGLVAALGGIAALFAGVAWKVGPEAVQRWHTAVMVPPVVLLMSGACGALRRPWAGGAVLALVAGLLLTASVRANADLSKPGNWIRVSAWIEQRETQGVPILVFINDGAMALELHYGGQNRVVPVPAPPRLDRFSPAFSSLESTEQALDVIRELPGPPRRLFVAWVHTEPYLGVDKHPERLADALRQSGRLLEEMDFGTCRVQHWELASGRTVVEPQ
jgi:hypothetical protein